jgi:hypothetical protein
MIIDIISKISPFLGSMLGGPVGGIVGSLISKTLGGIDMSDPSKVIDAIKNDPDAERKLKELELQLKDLQGAREQSNNETGALRFTRPLLAIIAMIAIVIDMYAIECVTNQIVQQILIVMLVMIVWDIRQIYKFYFGSGDSLPKLNIFKK